MTGAPDSPETIVARFNERINGRDLDGLASLMTEDHVFIDSEGVSLAGRQDCLAAWRGFFDAFPDYRNVFTSITAGVRGVTVVGRSECSEASLHGPALWTARVTDGKVSEWRVYDDTPEARARIDVD